MGQEKSNFVLEELEPRILLSAGVFAAPGAGFPEQPIDLLIPAEQCQMNDESLSSLLERNQSYTPEAEIDDLFGGMGESLCPDEIPAQPRTAEQPQVNAQTEPDAQMPDSSFTFAAEPAAENSITLRLRAQDHTVLELLDTASGTVRLHRQVAEITDVSVTGSPTGSNKFLIDFCTPFWLKGEITCTGGSGCSDGLILAGNESLNIHYTITGDGCGLIEISDQAHHTRISFTGFESIAIQNAANCEVSIAGTSIPAASCGFVGEPQGEHQGAHDEMVVGRAEDGDGLIHIRGEAGGRRIEPISLSHIASITLDPGSDDTSENDSDIITIDARAFGVCGLESITIQSGIGDDVISLGNGCAGTGALHDTCALTASSHPKITIDGGGGQDSLIGTDADSIWHMSGPGTGSMESSGEVNFSRVDYANIETLTGGAGADTFVFAGDVSLSGLIDGGGGINALDYSACLTGVVVDLEAGTATGTAGVRNIQVIVGNADTLILYGLEGSHFAGGAQAGASHGLRFLDFSIFGTSGSTGTSGSNQSAVEQNHDNAGYSRVAIYLPFAGHLGTSGATESMNSSEGEGSTPRYSSSLAQYLVNTEDEGCPPIIYLSGFSLSWSSITSNLTGVDKLSPERLWSTLGEDAGLIIGGQQRQQGFTSMQELIDATIKDTLVLCCRSPDE